MTTAGPNSPSTAANDAAVGTLTWASTSNVLASDDAYATVDTGAGGDATSKYLKVSGFGFSIPPGSTILGITVGVESWHDINDGTGISTYRARIVKAGSIGSTNKTLTWSTTEAVQNLGGSSDLWGETWTAAEINDASTGFAISVDVEDGGGATDVAYIDHITMTVEYTAGGPLSSEILRPISGLEEDAGDSFWNLIDDVVTQPTTPGDLSYMSIPHGVTQKFKVAPPTPGYTIISARLWILAHAEFDIAGVTEFKIFILRIKLNGTWYDLGVVDQHLTTTPTWYAFDLPLVYESTDSDDIGFQWIVTDPYGPYAGQYARMDVAYLELSYPPIEYSGYGPVSGTDEFYGVGGRTFEGYGSLSGTGDFSGTGTQPARGYGWVIGTDDFSGVGRVPDSGYGPVTGTGYFYGVGRLPDSGYGSVSGAGVLSGTGSVPASSAVVRLRRAGIMGEW